MNKYLSDKLKAISFFSMVLVVYLHSYNLIIRMSGNTESIKKGYNSFIQDFLSQGITRIAVPLFFIISGYLFFINIKQGFISEFIPKYKKRLTTLVLPYLFWSINGVLFFLILQSIPQSKPFFTHALIKNYSIDHLLSTIFINPIPYQLWFVRDLVVLVVLSPIIYWSIKKLKYFIILFLLINWLFEFNYVVFSNETILFFSIGAFFSIYKINIKNLKLKNEYLFFTISWITLIFCKTYLSYIEFNTNILNFLTKISILFGVIAVWLSYDQLFKNKDVSKTNLYPIFQYTFFLYVFHEPLLTIIKKSLYSMIGKTELIFFLIYIFTPVFTILIAILGGFCLKKFTPKFYCLITGGR